MAYTDEAGVARMRRLDADSDSDHGGGPARWIWAATAEIYPRLPRVERCHDLELTEALLLGYEGRWGEPRSLAAAGAGLTGAPVPADPPARAGAPPGEGQEALFDAHPARHDLRGDPVEVITRVYADQRARIAATAHPGRRGLLVAGESAGAMVAVEMGRYGLPWRVDVHHRLLTGMLGEPSPMGGPPRRLVELTGDIAEAFGQRIHPDSPAEVL
ncbi:MAG: polymerase, partial [Micromonosporaceae bacterium]|nr:polymerase [Micromonosporaceae bacterium]